jgi:predicted lipid-binding transport protein (Tim44 family)
MFAEIRLELSDRGAGANFTDVVECTAELLGMEILTNGGQLASVLFTGSLREAVGAPAQAFREVWNFLRRDGDSSDWLLAGIQQDAKQLH